MSALVKCSPNFDCVGTCIHYNIVRMSLPQFSSHVVRAFLMEGIGLEFSPALNTERNEFYKTYFRYGRCKQI